jgi:hypothetical protein
MIFSFGGLSPERTMLIADGATPYFFAHAFWLPSRFKATAHAKDCSTEVANQGRLMDGCEQQQRSVA